LIISLTRHHGAAGACRTNSVMQYAFVKILPVMENAKNGVSLSAVNN
jgi:hypothetical protein